MCHCWFEDAGGNIMKNAGSLREVEVLSWQSAGKQRPQSFYDRESNSVNILNELGSWFILRDSRKKWNCVDTSILAWWDSEAENLAVTGFLPCRTLDDKFVLCQDAQLVVICHSSIGNNLEYIFTLFTNVRLLLFLGCQCSH